MLQNTKHCDSILKLFMNEKPDSSIYLAITTTAYMVKNMTDIDQIYCMNQCFDYYFTNNNNNLRA